jgi:hypothetical protein
VAVYKVIQDIEAEDKLLGPLTLKSFVYALIAGSLAFVCVRLGISTLGDFKWAVIILLIFPILVFGILAAPIGKDQPTEVFILSHVRFLVQGHKKIWDQTGVSNLVTITAPKTLEKHLTKDFSQDEVKSRLKALASTLDSRGWAVKNVTLDINGQPGYFASGGGDSDRLVGTSNIAQTMPVLDIHPADDILDEQSNATAQNFSVLMQNADAKRKQEMLARFNAARQGEPIEQEAAQTVDYRFLDEHNAPTPGTGGSTFVGTNLTTPAENEDGNAVADRPAPKQAVELGAPELHDRHPHFKEKPSLAEERRQALDLQRQLEEQQKLTQAKSEVVANEVAEQTANTVTAAAQTAKMELSQSGNDLSVASIAKLANRHESIEQISPNEVVLHLH